MGLQRAAGVGDGVGAVEPAVDVEGGGQSRRTLGQFPVIAGRDSTFVSEVGTDLDIRRRGAEQATTSRRQAVRAIIYARLSPTPRGEESKGGNLTQQVELSQALCDRNG